MKADVHNSSRIGLSIKRPSKYLVLSGLTSLAFLTSLAVFTLSPVPDVHAVTPPDSCFAFNSGTGTITSYYLTEDNIWDSPDCPRAVDIPSTIGGVPVTSIGEYAFDSDDLTSLTIPNSVTSIGEGAFGWNDITTLSLPNSITSIEEYAFTGNQLTSVTVPEGVTSIGAWAFAWNYSLANVSLPATLTSIGASAFYQAQLASVTIPSSVTSIGESAFYENRLTSVTIPSGVAGVSNYAFYGNNLTSVTIQDGVTSIGIETFHGNQLTSITIPGSVTSIGTWAFGNNLLSSVTILNGTTSIGQSAFSQNQITSVTLPASLTTIGNSAFSENLLTSITIPDSVTTIGENAFEDNQLVSIIIPNGTTSISDEAFRNNQLTTVTIPNGVTSIGDFAFSGNQLTSVIIPGGVTSIGGYAFHSNHLASVTIPSSVTSIGDHAFMYNRLTRITVPTGVTIMNPYTLFGQSPWGADVHKSAFTDRYMYSNDPIVVQHVYDNLRYARTYTANSSNPEQLSDMAISESFDVGSDGNLNGNQTESLGGHIINPASTVIRYRSTDGNSIASDVTITGIKTGSVPSSALDSSDYLHSYLVTESAISAPLDPYNPTPEELLVMEEGFSQYYRLGDEVTFSPKTITGHFTPDAQTVTLTGEDTIVTFTYQPFVTSVSFSSNTVSGGELTYTQPPAGVHIPLITQSILSLTGANGEPSDCSYIESASLMAPSAIAGDVPAGTTLLGGVGFSLVCTNGGTTGIDYVLGSIIQDTSKLKVFKFSTSTNELTDITSQVTLSTKMVGGVNKTVISYSLTDGGAFDEDGEVNGIIEDPIVIGYAGDVSELAETGVNLWVLLAAGAGTLLLGIVLLVTKTKKRL